MNPKMYILIADLKDEIQQSFQTHQTVSGAVYAVLEQRPNLEAEFRRAGLSYEDRLIVLKLLAVSEAGNARMEQYFPTYELTEQEMGRRIRDCQNDGVQLWTDQFNANEISRLLELIPLLHADHPFIQ